MEHTQIKCPECWSNSYEIGMSSTTCIWVPPPKVIDWVLHIPPNPNYTTTELKCSKCNKRWRTKENPYPLWWSLYVNCKAPVDTILSSLTPEDLASINE